jgi:SAM-dependent methyltransferase
VRKGPNRSATSGGHAAAVSEKWLAANSGEHYARARFRGTRAAERDPSLVERCLRAHAALPLESVLDAPCGTARLRPRLARHARRYVGVDVSDEMLTAALRGAGAPGSVVRGDLAALPFRDGSFDAVVSCRLLHHVASREARLAIARELLRVSRDLVVASFWDASSLPGMRRRLGLKRSEGPGGRIAVARSEIADVFTEAGGVVLGFRHSFRFISQQTFIAVAKRARGG